MENEKVYRCYAEEYIPYATAGENTDDNGHFKGIIDFNMFGTEVNINCFLNESMYYYIFNKDKISKYKTIQ